MQFDPWRLAAFAKPNLARLTSAFEGEIQVLAEARYFLKDDTLVLLGRSKPSQQAVRHDSTVVR